MHCHNITAEYLRQKNESVLLISAVDNKHYLTMLSIYKLYSIGNWWLNKYGAFLDWWREKTEERKEKSA
jgi:hypothetical protein